MKSRTAAQKALLRAYKLTAPLGIGESRIAQQAREDAVERAVLNAVHDYVWRLRPNCQLCHGARSSECMGLPDQMHEDPPRSATRGRPPWERFNILVCGRVCAACHRDLTEHRLRVHFADPHLGFLGRVWPEPVPDVLM